MRKRERDRLRVREALGEIRQLPGSCPVWCHFQPGCGDVHHDNCPMGISSRALAAQGTEAAHLTRRKLPATDVETFTPELAMLCAAEWIDDVAQMAGETGWPSLTARLRALAASPALQPAPVATGRKCLPSHYPPPAAPQLGVPAEPRACGHSPCCAWHFTGGPKGPCIDEMYGAPAAPPAGTAPHVCVAGCSHSPPKMERKP